MSEYNKFEKGSDWRKWDLHMHTPCSISQNYGGDWNKFILSLERLPGDVKVIGITDYYFIDGFEKVMDYKKKGKLENIEKIFPILEFRIDTFGSGNQNELQKINLHILFDIDESKLKEECNKIREQFIERIPISRAEGHETKCLKKENFIEIAESLKGGFASLIPPTEKVFSLLENQTWKDKVFLFLGYKEWSNLNKNQQIKPIKEELYGKVQAFFTSNPDVTKNQNWLKEFGNKKLLHSGDIHEFDFMDTAIPDDSGGFKDSEKYRCLTWIKSDPTFNGLKQISYEPEERVRIQDMRPEEGKTGYHVIDSVVLKEEKFWDCEIKLNQNLNSIIGGRSTGKSTLLQSIAKKVNNKVDVSKFVSEHLDGIFKFVSKHLDGIEVKWLDGDTSTRDIEFFSQNQLAKIAEDREETNSLNSLIEGIIKSENKKNKLSQFESFQSTNRTKLMSVIPQLYRVKSDLELKEKELLELGDKKGVQNEINKINIKLESLNQGSSLSEEEVRSYEDLTNRSNSNNEKIERLKTDLPKLNNLKDIQIIQSNFEYNFHDLSNDTRTTLEQSFDLFKKRIGSEWVELITKIGSDLESQVSSIKGDQETINKDPTYKKGLELESTNKEFKDLKQKLSDEQSKLTDIIEKEESIQSIRDNLEELKKEVIDLHFSYSEKIIELTSDLYLNHEGIEIKADYILDSGLGDFLVDRLNQKSQERKEYVSEFVKNYKQDIRELTADILMKSLSNQLELKGGNRDENVITELLSNNWLRVTYIINYEDDVFKEMSPGKQAFVILKLLLEFSENKCPILIDQPEDSLDNRSIYDDLVQYLKSKKKDRQIILVTHNPNVVVNSDSEQIIVANQHGKDSPNNGEVKFHYVTGSLEHSFSCVKGEPGVLESKGIREHVCEILEGGTEAFTKREQKYEI